MAEELYHETYRPQFHFTAKKNWLNDPNGLVYYKGEYHLFFQHNPHGLQWGPNTWGHAISPDLVHWQQIEHAIEPDKMGWIWSGSAVVDWKNTSGFQSGDEKALVAFYTTGDSTLKPKKPCVQCIAYSNDRGRTWTKYAHNPVLGYIIGENRDPKVIWHEPTKTWIMALFLDGDDYALFSSPNLKNWTRLCDVHIFPGTNECPDIFELPVDKDADNTRWVFWGGNGNYRLGSFDGTTFQPKTGPLQSNWGGNCYAAQTWSDIPASDGRRIQIAWMRMAGQYPGMPFNQQMSFPVELTLRTTPEGIRLSLQPVKEIENLHAQKHAWTNQPLKPGKNLLADLSGELFDFRAEIDLGAATEVGFALRGEKVQYHVASQTVTSLSKTAPLAPIGNRIKLQVLLDRTSIEVFGNDGLVCMPTCFFPDRSNTSLGIYAEGGEAKIISLEISELRSAWK